MTQINFRIEEDVKLNAEKALKEMGLNMSTAITMFLVKVGREKRIPFEINADPFYSAENIAELERRVTNIQNGTSTLKEHDLIEVDNE
ncbi:MAG: type II toxin-antitoxin system RelB/DinJ family antitoxin [Oscillospiraceae bacterium]|nr:type II toxin-antitoxin system RelB/DinJ family antitoxin [Oscillospiraceae bacterium]MDE6005438.1 type II toxin-antitoxin system RelB/DinJ family antitoxin [Oscillospiraceae bacterium]